METFSYLLDTNILSDIIKHPAGAVVEKIAEVGEGTICTSIIVACELRFSAVKKGSQLLTTRVEQLLERIEVLSLGEKADEYYASLRHDLEKNGALIGPNDLLIAAHALDIGVTLVTDNLREFTRIKGLSVENWL